MSQTATEPPLHPRSPQNRLVVSTYILFNPGLSYHPGPVAA